MKGKKVIYSGKAKTLYSIKDNDDELLLEFRDDITAFNAKKNAKLKNKGKLNNIINAFVMTHLNQEGIENHFVKKVDDTHSIVKKLEMLQVECVVRNLAAGSLTRRLGIKQGAELDPPIYEWFYKNDELNDPMINEYHIKTMNLANEEDLQAMQKITFRVNDILKSLFIKANILLVDFKLEFGKYNGKLILGDEFTPDGCRLWDVQTRKVLDKDRFRIDLGDVVEAYQEIADRLGIK